MSHKIGIGKLDDVEVRVSVVGAIRQESSEYTVRFISRETEDRAPVE